MKNIIILSKQLKYARDIPQAIITYDKQSDEDLSFQIIFARIIKLDTSSIKELLSKSNLKYSIDEVKKVGYLKKRYPKEAAIFHIMLKKNHFFRRDFSLDLQKARHILVQELTNVMGEFRDYNGGMILKQKETFESLRQEIGKHNDYLLENFYYSIKPGYMKSIVPTSVLKSLYFLLTEAMDHDFSIQPFFHKTQTLSRYFLVMISSTSKLWIEQLIESIKKIRFDGSELTYTLVTTYEIFSLGILLQNENPKDLISLQKILNLYLKKNFKQSSGS